jgi:hypothetical protein
MPYNQGSKMQSNLSSGMEILQNLADRANPEGLSRAGSTKQAPK